MKLLNRVYVNLTDEQLAGLKERAQRNGSAVAEEIRRAVAVSLKLYERVPEQKASA